MILYRFEHFDFRLDLVYIDNLASLPLISKLKKMVQPYGLSILMVDCSCARYMDLHCYWMDE